jgi:hypothetical protein
VTVKSPTKSMKGITKLMAIRLLIDNSLPELSIS